jgi:single-strand DNA-binding protein
MRLNIVVVGGNLVRDPDFKEVGDTHKAEFAIAINRKFKDKSGALKEEVDFIAIVAWGRLAEVARDYLKKGSSLIVEGQIRQERWNDNEGNSRSKTKVYAGKFTMTGKRPSNNEANAPENEDHNQHQEI